MALWCAEKNRMAAGEDDPAIKNSDWIFSTPLVHDDGKRCRGFCLGLANQILSKPGPRSRVTPLG